MSAKSVPKDSLASHLGCFTKNKFLKPQAQQIEILKKEIKYKYLISSGKSSNKIFHFYLLRTGILHKMFN